MAETITTITRPIVTRIAPSPTGDPHIGTAYIGLFNYVLAAKQQGTFILRIEDTDRERYQESSEDRILRMMHWLGLAPDESPEADGPNGPYRQSERLAIYKAHAETLFEQGKLYASFMTEDELAHLRKEQKQRGLHQLGYDGREREMPLAEAKARIAAGEPYVLRLRTPEEGDTSFDDVLRGTVTIANKEIRDSVMIKRDGYPTYHFANVVDDHLMGVTHVMRAEEWVTSTPTHVLLYEAFGWSLPAFIHLPLLRNPDKNKSKISKRKVNTSVEAYRDEGIVPEALLNYLGLMGWSMPNNQEFFSLDELINAFDPTRLGLGAPVFDAKKLRHINAHYIREVLDLEDVAARVKPFLKQHNLSWQEDEDYLLDVLDIMLDRVETLADFADQGEYFFQADVSYTEDAKKKISGGQVHLEGLERELAQLDEDNYDYDSVNDTIRSYVKTAGARMPEVMMPLRAAITGKLSSPDISEVVSVIGRAKTLSRLGRAITYITEGLPDDKPEKSAKQADTKKADGPQKPNQTAEAIES